MGFKMANPRAAPDLFNEEGQAAIDRARDEARQWEHNYIGQEHFLLGFTSAPECAAARLLASLDIDSERLRSAIGIALGKGEAPADVARDFAPRASRALELALLETGEHDAGSQHMLLGILLEGTGFGAGILHGLGVTLEKARRAA